MKSITNILAAAACLTLGCQPTQNPGTTEERSGQSPLDEARYLVESAVIAGDLQAALGPRLMAALKAGGPAKAIGVCQRLAQGMTKSTSERHPGVEVTRTSLRVRNPLNHPDALSSEILGKWQTKFAETGQMPRPELRVTDDSIIVHRPIMTAELCLQCHGEEDRIDEETRKILDKTYPEDMARGYNEGDLRGAFRITFARDQAR